MRQTIRKTAALAAVCMILCALLSACGAKEGKEISARVTIVNGEEVLLSEEVSVEKDTPTAQDALEQACRSKKLAFQNKNGLYDGFGGVESTQTDGWLFYFDGELAEQGAADTPLSAEGENQIEMRYVNYEEAFAN